LYPPNKSKVYLQVKFDIYKNKDYLKYLSGEPISKRFSLVKIKAGENFNRRNTLSILRIEI